MSLEKRIAMRGMAIAGRQGRQFAYAAIGLAAVTLAVLGIVGVASPAQAETEPYSNEDYRKAVDQLGCIQCSMRPLFGCETPTCLDTKLLIRQKLIAGESPNEIVQFFVDRYGDAILLSPPARGLNLLIWLLPATALIAGAFAVRGVLRSRRHSSGPLTISSSDDGYEAQVEEEVRAIQRGHR